MHADKEIQCALIDDRMTRSILLEASDASDAVRILQEVEKDDSDLISVAKSTSRFVKLIDIHSQVAGNLIFKVSFKTGDAAGHSMCTKAAEAIMNHLLERFSSLV